jgi:hypothetical protein
MVLPCNFTAVYHDSKTKISKWQSFFNFQENLNERKLIPSKSWHRSPSLIWCIGTFLSDLKMAYFRPFSNFISIKMSCAVQKIPPTWWRPHGWRPVQVLYNTKCKGSLQCGLLGQTLFKHRRHMSNFYLPHSIGSFIDCVRLYYEYWWMQYYNIPKSMFQKAGTSTITKHTWQSCTKCE